MMYSVMLHSFICLTFVSYRRDTGGRGRRNTDGREIKEQTEKRRKGRRDTEDNERKEGYEERMVNIEVKEERKE